MLIDHTLYETGIHVVDFTTRGFADGVYFYRLEVESGGKCFVDTKRIVIGK
ncbi:MAG: hypothetical protein HYR76_01290 [Ignavibacteria bacterium]|nr:hypothetical protein [Ignavibacteria bacterium]